MSWKAGVDMFNFFVEESAKIGSGFIISGSDYNHIKNVLRMNVGDEFLVSCNGASNLCAVKSFDGESVAVEIIEENYQDTSLPVDIILFQGLPKSDKMELIIQKAVELGVSEIYPVEMKRCVVKLDDKKKKTKTVRWQAIAESAAKQSKRNSVPTVHDAVGYSEALKRAKELDLMLVPYEAHNGMESTREALGEIKKGNSVGILIGPEGGFEDKEIENARENGAKIISLGKRILRTETAAITAVGMCMMYSEMFLNGEDE